MAAASEHYDAIIIGAGQAGVPLATALAKSGRRTALVEREHVGGTCINEGCTPTKTMVASARVAYLARRAADYGVQTGPVAVDMARVRRRKRDIVESFRSGEQHGIETSDGLDLIFGHARFAGPKELLVRTPEGATRNLAGEWIFIDTGDRPSRPTLPGIDAVSRLNSTSIMELEVVPDHLLVLGGGYIGLEFGQMFRRFGSRVTIIQRGARLLEREDADVADEVLAIMRQDGLGVLLNSTAARVEQSPGGEIHLTVQTPDSERILVGTHLLEAVGRVPNTDDLGLEQAGIVVNGRGFIQVNDRLETSVPSVYALGDVKGGAAFTHISYDDFRIIRTNLLEGGSTSIRDRQVPYTVYIDPQLGHIGVSEEEARQQGRDISVAKMPMAQVARALETDESRGFMKAIVDNATDQILGCVVLGIEGGELMSMLQVAMLGGVTASTLRDAVFAHPTLAESFNNLFSKLEKRPAAPMAGPSE